MGVMAGVAMTIGLSETASAYEPRVHCAEDTAMVAKVLRAVTDNGGTLGERIAFAARQLEGTPWSNAEDRDTTGTVIINMHGFDRLGFVNTAMALGAASLKPVPRVEEFELLFENMSRRKGEDNGFPSRLIYVSDWIVDNVYRGNLKEMTEYVTGGGFKTKTLDYVSHHPEEYPALKNPEVLEKVKMNEMGYRSHRIPHLKKQSAANKPLHELMQTGDVIVMLSPQPDFDLYDIGVIEMRGGEPYLIHISHENGSVVADPYPLARLFKLDGQHFYGYRWLRPQE